MPTPTPIRDAALKWVRVGVGVVPVRPRLVLDEKGKLSPIPWIRWQQDGPLRTGEDVSDFWWGTVTTPNSCPP